LNAARNKARSEHVRLAVALDDISPVPTDSEKADRWVIQKEESRRISQALMNIPFDQREVVVLHLLGEMKFRQIAQLQSVSIKTSQSRYRYGIDKLRSILDSEVEK